MEGSPIYLKINDKYHSFSNKNYPNSKPPYWDWCLIKEDLISVNIKERGFWENHLALIYQHLIKPGDVVIDAGANIGGHTLNFAHSVGDKGKVIAFEPQPFVFNVLTTNILINNLTSRITQFKLALFDALKVVKMDPTEYHQPLTKEKGGYHFNGNPISVNHGGPGISNSSKGGEIVSTTTIDTLELNRLDLIKMDIQGSELNALKGGIKTIKKFKPILLVENYAHRNSSKDIKVIELLKSWGYTGYRLLIGNEDDCIFVHDNVKKVKNIIQKYHKCKKI